MNAYLAEIIAAERMAEFEREAEHARLVRQARGGSRFGGTASHVRVSTVVAAAAFVVTLWLAVTA
ncbi:MAG: hypothetical protein ACJ77D_01670 [Chloroflexota bacterium]|jgi:hypothetical protein